MFKQLRRLFSAGDPLIELARSGNSSLFKETFCASEVFVVSKAGSITLEPESMTADELQTMMESAAREWSDTDSFELFVYGPEGGERLPVFSCREAADTFVRNYVQAVNRVIPFVVGSLEGVRILPLLQGSIRMILNPLTDDETELPRDFQAELVR